MRESKRSGEPDSMPRLTGRVQNINRKIGEEKAAGAGKAFGHGGFYGPLWVRPDKQRKFK